MTNIEKVRKWRTIAGQPMDTGKVSELAIRLVQEEAREVLGAIKEGDLKEIAKELCDLEYVLIGAVLENSHKYTAMFNRYDTYSLCTREDRIEWASMKLSQHKGLPDGIDSIFSIRLLVQSLFHSFFPEKDFDTAFAEVHRSNMSKFVDGKCLKRDDGKILKGPDFSPADMSFMVPGLEELKRMPSYLNTEK